MENQTYQGEKLQEKSEHPEEGKHTERKKQDWKRWKVQVCATVLLLVMGIALLWAPRKIAGFAEWYSQTIYPVLVGTVGRVFGLAPFSAVELVLYGGIGILIFWLFRYRRRPVILVRNYSTVAAVLLFLYASCCGVNYYRVPFSTYYINDLLEGREEAVTIEAEKTLREMCVWLIGQVNEARKELDAVEGNYEKIQKKGVAAMERLAEQYPALSGYYPQPKPVAVSWILSIQQCSGVYSPFTIEANYNRDMVPYNIPHTICHELSHLRGFMREDEANFIGYLACIGSEDADYRYSGYLMGWIHAGNALSRIDYNEYVRLHELLDQQVILELSENSEFWDQYEGEVAEVQEKVNDAYLKANGQSDGVKSYGRVVDLMLVDFALNRQP